MNYALESAVGGEVHAKGEVQRADGSVEPRTRIGMLTPSSNTVLEPMTSAILAELESVSAHYARLRVTEISNDPKALAQFDMTPMLEAASMLADVRPKAMVWNGTSGGWRGIEADRRLAATIEAQFDLGVSTVTIALHGLLKAQGIKRLAFVTPYTADIQAKIIENFTSEGFSCTVSPCLGISENFAFGTVSAASMDAMVAEAAAARPEVIIPFCTNLAATPHAGRWEEEYGIPIFDSVAVAARAGLELSGIAPRAITGWGRIFGL